MLKYFSFCAVILGSMFAFQSCQNDANVPSPGSTNYPTVGTVKNVSSLEAIEEVQDDESSVGARVALAVAPIDKANRVYQVFKITGTYSTTGTSTGATLAVNTDGSSAATLSDTTVKTKNGWSVFSVKTEKYNTYLKKAVDKTKSQVYYMKDKDAKIWYKMTTVAANGTTFSFLTDYLTKGITFSASGATSETLN